MRGTLCSQQCWMLSAADSNSLTQQYLQQHLLWLASCGAAASSACCCQQLSGSAANLCCCAAEVHLLCSCTCSTPGNAAATTATATTAASAMIAHAVSMALQQPASPWHHSVQEPCKALAPQQLLHLLCWQLLRCSLR
jgi:hypothetical protein